MSDIYMEISLDFDRHLPQKKQIAFDGVVYMLGNNVISKCWCMSAIETTNVFKF
jgi:hypothetical protein